MCLIYNTAPPECSAMYVLNTFICFKCIQADACLRTPRSLFILGGYWVCLIYSLVPPGCVFTRVQHHPTPPLVWKGLIKHIHTGLQRAQFDWAELMLASNVSDLYQYSQSLLGKKHNSTIV